MYDSLLGPLPDNWLETDLSDFVPNPGSDIVDGPFGSNLKASEYMDSGIPIVRIQNVDRNRFIDKNINFVTVDKAKQLERHNFQPHDVVITKLGAPLGRAALVPARFGPGVIVADVVRCRVDNRYANSRYVMFAINSLPSVTQLASETKGTTRPRVNLKHIRSLRLPMPPRNEQDRIVEKIETLFTELDKGEEALRAAQKLLARYRQSVLKAAVTGTLTADWRASNSPAETGQDLLARILETRRKNWQGRGRYSEPVEPDTNELPELPEGWAWAGVDQVTSVFRNGLSKKPTSKPNELPILRISSVRAMEVSLDDLRYYEPDDGERINDAWTRRGDLLFTRYNGSAHLVGVCGLMRSKRPVLHPDKLIRATPVVFDGLAGEFLEIAWNAGVTRKHIEAHTKTTSGQQGIAGGDIKAAPFPLPSAAEQEVIVDRVTEALAKTRNLVAWCETELRRSAALRQSILKDAFSGKLVPQHPSDEPAETLLERIRTARAAATRAKRRKATA